MLTVCKKLERNILVQMKDFMYILCLIPSIPAIFQHFLPRKLYKGDADTGKLNAGETLALSSLKALAHLKPQAMQGGSGCNGAVCRLHNTRSHLPTPDTEITAPGFTIWSFASVVRAEVLKIRI